VQIQSESFCAATLDQDLSIQVPYLSYDGNLFRAEFSHVPDTLTFNLVDYETVTDVTAFEGCSPATLSSTFLLKIPNLLFGGASYWLDLQYTNEGSTMRYEDLGVNY